MTNRKVVHEVKLEKSVKIILGILAIGVCLNAFAPAFSVQEALAAIEHLDTLNVRLSGYIGCSGCN